MKNNLFGWSLLCILSVWITGCKTEDHSWKEKSWDAANYHAGIQQLTQIIKNDIFSPPVASRIYAYSSIAGYEALAAGDERYDSYAGKLKDLTPPPAPNAGETYCFPVAGLTAMLTVGKALVFSENSISDLESELLANFQSLNIPEDVFQRSVEYGKTVASHILAWSKTDNYAQTRSLPKYTITHGDLSRWVPTPPSYADALEPYWMTIRQWGLDSLNQFTVADIIPFSITKGSEFYNAAMEVVDIAANRTEEQEATAWYWDDNPYAVEASGHLMQARKKTTPGGHWMFITTDACKAANADIMLSAAALAAVGVAIADGFIMTWQEKFRTNLVRPETYINKIIDPDFRPLIETPPFPEHPSGHATISAAAAAVLTHIFGSAVTFTDHTEEEYGMAARTYQSFRQAAEESAMSRLYGGIHYRHGNASGTELGWKIGMYIGQKLLPQVNQ